jgi:hypothetical protein
MALPHHLSARREIKPVTRRHQHVRLKETYEGRIILWFIECSAHRTVYIYCGTFCELYQTAMSNAHCQVAMSCSPGDLL